MAKKKENNKENLKGMKVEELRKMLAEAREDLRKIHFTAVGAKSKNVKEGATLKKHIARIMTEINAAK